MYEFHASREESYWWFVAKNRIIWSLIERFHQPGYRTSCDIGCGCGGLLARLAAKYQAVGVDMHPLARKACTERGLTAVDGSLPDNVPFQRESFDVIVCSEVIEHVERDREAVAAVCRLLRPGGLLVCTVPAHQWMWSAHDVYNHHFRRYTRAGFGALFSGLPMERLALSYYNCSMFPPMAAVRLLGKVVGSGNALGSGGPEIKPLPRLINGVLTRVFAAERHWLPHARLPMGSSVIGVYRKLPVEVNVRERANVPAVAAAAV
jgi:SAM-dependent methyltransferase